MYDKKQFMCLSGITMLSLTSFEVSAQSSNLWQINLKSDAGSATVQSKKSNVTISRLNQQDAINKSQQRDITKLSWQSNGGNGLKAVNLNYTEGEYSAAMGYQQDKVTLSAMAGSGKEYARMSSDYSGLDPYLFHGGNSQNFNYVGVGLDVAVSKDGHIQFGYADVSSDLLEARRTQYIEWATNRYFVRGSYFQRGSHGLGYGLDAGFYMGGVQVAYQALDLDDDKSMHRVRFHYQQDQSKQYWIDLSNSSNALYAAKNDYKVMFSMRMALGTEKARTNYTHDGEQSDVYGAAVWGQPSNRIQRSSLIETSAAAGVVAASSGNAQQDRAKRATGQHDAAHIRLNSVNPVSIAENREYGGYIYQNQDGSFSSTEAVVGEENSITLPNPRTVTPVGTKSTASYHTHSAGQPGHNEEYFSESDLHADRVQNLDGYLGTPKGAFMYHEVSTGKTSRIGSIQH